MFHQKALASILFFSFLSGCLASSSNTDIKKAKSHSSEIPGLTPTLLNDPDASKLTNEIVSFKPSVSKRNKIKILSTTGNIIRWAPNGDVWINISKNSLKPESFGKLRDNAAVLNVFPINRSENYVPPADLEVTFASDTSTAEIDRIVAKIGIIVVDGSKATPKKYTTIILNNGISLEKATRQLTSNKSVINVKEAPKNSISFNSFE